MKTKDQLSNIKNLTTPLTDEAVAELRAGDSVKISGTVYTVRDASSRRLEDDIRAGKTPMDLAGGLIFYLGPTPARPGRVIGAAGPTTSSRMDSYVPDLVSRGVKAFLGKGRRSIDTRAVMQANGAVYLAAVGGIGALLSRHIGEATVAAYPELGPEAVYRLVLDEFPAVVADDIYGGDLFEQEWPKWTSSPTASS
jgi:fumarate hydratase subunit beta